MINNFWIDDDRTLLMSKKKRGDGFCGSSAGSSGCVDCGEKKNERERVEEREECHPPNNHAKQQQQLNTKRGRRQKKSCFQPRPPQIGS